MRSSLRVPFLIAGMLSVGAGMSLLIKYQDMQCVENCDDPEPHNHVAYEQPVWQTLIMFGEFDSRCSFVMIRLRDSSPS